MKDVSGRMIVHYVPVSTMAKHLRFLARTVMVKDGDFQAAYKTLSSVLFKDGIIQDVKLKRYYEKPCRERQRKNFENCRRIYGKEMSRKIDFISRTNRKDPWFGC
ncbi:small ribosomal subunit protein bS21m [Antennarius striatus]|uniref:small ribosomal subunit protein bS21m n=1 Tax=Antennarius striatus TaxID=241820 RepID=UPI0035B1CA0E